jgi:hypothetical protein
MERLERDYAIATLYLPVLYVKKLILYFLLYAFETWKIITVKRKNIESEQGAEENIWK